VRTRRRSRRRPYSPWLISHKVRNLAGDLCSRPVGRLSGADGDEAAEIAPNSTALSNLGASAGAYFIEPLPGGPSQACPPSPYPRRTANEYRDAAPNEGQDPFRHASPHLPTTSRSSRRKIPHSARPPQTSAPPENLLRPSRPPATSSDDEPLPLERASSGSSEFAHAAKPSNETHARQTLEVRARRRSRRRPGLRRLISREVRNLAGGRCSRLAAGTVLWCCA